VGKIFLALSVSVGVTLAVFFGTFWFTNFNLASALFVDSGVLILIILVSYLIPSLKENFLDKNYFWGLLQASTHVYLGIIWFFVAMVILKPDSFNLIVADILIVVGLFVFGSFFMRSSAKKNNLSVGYALFTLWIGFLVVAAPILFAVLKHPLKV